MELESEEAPAAWCLSATLQPGAPAGPRDKPRDLPAGTKVYCFPPNVTGAYESVKVIARDPRSARWIRTIVPASELVSWEAQAIRDRDLLSQIAPPWDATEASRDVARGIAAWKSGGNWPAAELRIWNRAHAQTSTGKGSILSRLKDVIARVREK